jgi:energy-coupling factor transporter ATP-binding protein EcfA2
MPVAELARRLDLKAAQEHPYPGLRPFEIHESILFFGRENHTRELLRRLGKGRMLAVVGTSGSGKSSLVKAGLLPALYSGHLAGAGTGWRIAVMRPGSAPLDELAKSLERAGAVSREALRGTLGQTSLGLVEAASQLLARSRENLLVVVDQFEELFRFRRERERADGGAEASLFVASLLEAVEQVETPVYVVLTMRSDFLGDCAQFAGLPEALNRSQYLIPRLTRDQRREAIEGPLRIAGADATPRLVQRLLNDAGDDPDQLPVLQHALMATFAAWRRDGAGVVDLRHYESAGALKDALNRHAESVHRSLDKTDRGLCEQIFRCLTTMEAGRAVRRPSRLGRIYAVVGAETEADRARVRDVIRRFMDPANNFLVSSDPELPEEAVVDISHESLIRKWATLQEWVREEADSAAWYRDVSNSVRLRFSGEGGLWSDPELSTALDRRRRDGWNAAWAEQYGGSWKEATEFLDDSVARKRRQWLVRALVTCAFLALVVAAWGAWRRSAVNAERLQQVKEERALELKLNQRRDQEAREAAQRLAEFQRAMDDLKRELDQARSPQRQAALVRAANERATAQIRELEAQLKQARMERDDALRRSMPKASKY